MNENGAEESTTSKSNLLSSTIQHSPSNFIRILVIIALASLLFCILIIFIIAMLIKTQRFHLPSSEDKVSSSSFSRSSITATSTADFPNEIYQFKPQSILSYNHSPPYGNYFPTFLPGLVPQGNLSPRFYRPYLGHDRRPRRTPVHIQSPSVSSSNQGLLTTNRRIHRPTITRLQNGDVLISA